MTATPTTAPPALSPPPQTTRQAPRPAPRRRPRTVGSIVGRGLKGLVLGIAVFFVLAPFLGVVSTSIASPEVLNAAGGFVFLPTSFSLDAYTAIFSGGVVTQALVVSAGVTAAGTGLSLLCSTLLAYSLSFPGSFAHRPILFTVLLTLFFVPGIIPSYLVVKELGMLDSYWALILPTAVSGFNVIVLRAFFMGIPRELIESARIDGAGQLAIFGRIVLPLSKAVLAVVGLFYAVGYWNSFFTALLYMYDSAKWPLQLVLRTYVVNGSTLGGADLGAVGEVLPPQNSIQMATLIISIVPILLVYPFLQRHFAKGVLTGAVKG
jgi:putative aldouronate transport system permease protein